MTLTPDAGGIRRYTMIQAALAPALSAAVGYILYHRHVPAGMMIGAVIAPAVPAAVFPQSGLPASRMF